MEKLLLGGRTAILAGLALLGALLTQTAAYATPPPREFKSVLKTNLLFLAAGAPNIGVEIPFGEGYRFSAGATAAATKWQINNKYALQTMQGGFDVKYWFDPEERPMTGFNAGLYVHFGGRYDVQWRKGWQGDRFFSTGIECGYSMPISCRFNLEFSLAAGGFHTPEARHYEVQNDYLMWRQTRYNVGRFSLTRARVNLVWLFGRKERSQ